MKRLFFILAAIIASFLFSGNVLAQSSYFDRIPDDVFNNGN